MIHKIKFDLPTFFLPLSMIKLVCPQSNRVQKGKLMANSSYVDDFIKEINKSLSGHNRLPKTKGEFSELLDKFHKVLLENRELNLALDYSVDSIHISDGEGNILRVNTAFENYTGQKRQDIIGRNVNEMVTSKIYEPSIVKLVLKERRKLTMLQKAFSNGEETSAITTSTPIFNEDGSIFMVVSNARPVAELKLLHDFFNEQSRQLNATSKLDEFQYSGSRMKDLYEMSEYVAKVESSIFISGESGTGKSLLARFIHQSSNRSQGPFIEVNCAAIPENLMESEFFGYATGAFTGAKAGGKPGLVELADGGTLFLDEIGDMPLNLQSKLLQVIQNKTITRVGGERPIQVDLRIISATNQDLPSAIKNGSFRSDLYYRLNVVPLEIPPLRDHKEDIIPLANFFVDKFNKKYDKSVLLSQSVLDHFIEFDWPGNVRELENLIERLIVINHTGLVTSENLPENFRAIRSADGGSTNGISSSPSLKGALEELEKHLILQAYERLGSSYQVAEYFNISQASANRRIRKYLQGH